MMVALVEFCYKSRAEAKKMKVRYLFKKTVSKIILNTIGIVVILLVFHLLCRILTKNNYPNLNLCAE